MRKKNIVCGVGRNDADYQVFEHAVIGGKDKIIWACPYYQVWSSMLKRCYSAKLHYNRPTYIECFVDPKWLIFSVFREWMSLHNWKGNQLDKDILCPGNKIYRPDYCIFVSSALNNFITDSRAARGEWPIGVSLHKKTGKFQATCKNPFTRKYEYLGLYSCPTDAHDVWRAKKQQHAYSYAEMQDDPRIARALRDRFS